MDDQLQQEPDEQKRQQVRGEEDEEGGAVRGQTRRGEAALCRRQREGVNCTMLRVDEGSGSLRRATTISSMRRRRRLMWRDGVHH